MGLQFTQHMTRKIECNGSILAYLVYKSFIYWLKHIKLQLFKR